MLVIYLDSSQALVGVPAAVGRLFRVEIDATIRATATAFAEPTLRSLDAIHLATAQLLANEAGATLTAFVTYNQRLLASARTVGLPTASPGLNETYRPWVTLCPIP